jgi:hypothetical protein
MLANIILQAYPHAPFDAWRVQDDGDGPHIAYWDEQAIGAPKPDVAELLANAGLYELGRRKKLACEAIDARSEQLLTAGLAVAEGKVISTSDRAQRNLLQLAFGVQAGSATLPQGVATIDEGEYTITDATDLKRIQDLWHQRSTSVLDAGRALKMAVLAAESIEAIDAVVDERE